MDNLEKPDEVQMILDRVFGREPPEQPASSSDEAEEAAAAEDPAAAASEAPSIKRETAASRKRDSRPAGLKTEFDPANIQLAASRIKMDHWLSSAHIATPDFAIKPPLLDCATLSHHSDSEVTDDEHFTRLHISEEHKEIAARKSTQQPKVRRIRGKGAFKTPKRRGRPPRPKRKRKSQFAHTRSTMPQLSSRELSEEHAPFYYPQDYEDDLFGTGGVEDE